MKNIIKKIPVPIAGLILALATMGNLLEDIHINIKYAYGITALVLSVLLLLRIVFYKKSVIEDLKNPLILTVFPTFYMAMMVLATYAVGFSFQTAFILWLCAVLFHFLWIIYVTKRLILKFNIEKIFPSIFVSYVGIITASVTAPVFKMYNLGKIIFYFGFISYLFLLIIVIFRVVKIKKIPESAIPACAIFAAPASLSLAGYINSFQNKNNFMIIFLFILSLIMTFTVLFLLFRLHTKNFYPSFSAFTFPFVISALSLKIFIKYLEKSSYSLSKSIFVNLTYIYYFELIFSILIVFYVLFRYIFFLISKQKTL